MNEDFGRVLQVQMVTCELYLSVYLCMYVCMLICDIAMFRALCLGKL
jgi:hypothetical protein